MTVHFSRMAVIGLGLIGGSLALAARKAGVVDWVVGCASRQASLDKGLALGVIDEGFLSAAEAVKNADLVFLSVPVAAMPSVMAEIAPFLKPETVVTDGGSVKQFVWQAAQQHLPNPANFIPGHPIAGREKSGVEAAVADLYQDHRVILTPTANNSIDAVQKVTELWEATGAIVEVLDIEEHDRVLAETSHLPHLLAFSLVDSLSRQGDSHDIFHYAAGGFRDFTRIASSSPIMWRDVFLHNSDATLAALDIFEEGLKQFRQAVIKGDASALMQIMTRANQARDYFLTLQHNQDQETKQ